MKHATAHVAPSKTTPVRGFRQALARARKNIEIADIYAEDGAYISAAELLVNAATEYKRAHRIRSTNINRSIAQSRAEGRTEAER